MTSWIDWDEAEDLPDVEGPATVWDWVAGVVLVLVLVLGLASWVGVIPWESM